VDVFLGTARDKLLDRADPGLALSPVVDAFGKFMKIIVRGIGEQEVVDMNRNPSQSRPVRNIDLLSA
jgi:hypothetical protein